MLKRNIMCPSLDSAKLLTAWLPKHVVDSSSFYVNKSQTLVGCSAAPILRQNELQLLLIRNAYTYHEELILDMEGDSEEMLSLHSSERRFEVEVVAPALEWMLFETPEIFETIFRDKATSRLQLIGSYEPDRAIREAGTTVNDIIARVDDKTRELLRATPRAQRILKRIEQLDEKAFT